MENSLSVTLRAVLRGVVERRVRVHGFAASSETTDRGCRGLGLTRNGGLDGVVVGSVGGSLGVLWDRSRYSINVGPLLGLVHVRVVRQQVGGDRGLLGNIGRRNRSHIIDTRIRVG